MPHREPIPPIPERIQPTLIQKRPGKWTARFRWQGLTKDRALGLTVDPTPKGDAPPVKIERLALRKFTRPYLAGEWSPFEDDVYGPLPGHQRGPTIAEATATFLARYDSSKTKANYESILRLFEESLEPHTLVSEVEPDEIRAFVYRETSLQNGVEKPITRSTQKHSWRHLRAFFNWAIKSHIIDENPVEEVDAPRVEQRSKSFLAPGDLGRVLSALDDQLPAELSAAYRVALGAGLRRDELRHLQARDVDLDYGVVLIRSKEMVQAKGGEWRPKGRRDRRVPLNPLARRAMAGLVEASDSRHNVLFSTDGDVIREERLTKALRTTLDDLGLHLPRPLHALRGLYITYMLLLGWPLPVVQELVGHVDSSMTMNYWRSASTVLWGDARHDFREAAIELGFEPYHAAGFGPSGYSMGTPGVRDATEVSRWERNTAET